MALRRIAMAPQTATSAAAAGTSVLLTMVGLSKFHFFTIDALLLGATGGTLDLYLQRLIDATNGIWLDWGRFAQLAAGAAAIDYTIGFDQDAVAPAITHVGQFNAAGAGTAVVAAGSIVPCHPGDQLRVLQVAGAGTSAGAAQSFYVTGFESYT